MAGPLAFSRASVMRLQRKTASLAALQARLPGLQALARGGAAQLQGLLALCICPTTCRLRPHRSMQALARAPSMRRGVLAGLAASAAQLQVMHGRGSAARGHAGGTRGISSAAAARAGSARGWGTAARDHAGPKQSPQDGTAWLRGVAKGFVPLAAAGAAGAQAAPVHGLPGGVFGRVQQRIQYHQAGQAAQPARGVTMRPLSRATRQGWRVYRLRCSAGRQQSPPGALLEALH